MNSDQRRIGIVGTGRMGANMARRLAEKGYAVTALYDIKEAVAGELAQELQTQSFAKLHQVTAHADIIVTVVSDDAAMRAIYFGESDSLLHEARNKIFINCATLTPSVHSEFEKVCKKVGAQALEACMASSILQARQGTLYLMVGGEHSTFLAVEDILKDLSQTVRYIGAAGSAAKVKALVNMVMNMNTAALAEGLGLGAHLGIDLTVLKEVFSQTGANSRVLETDGADMIGREHDCFFSAQHAAKDSAIANQLARDCNCQTPLSFATEAQYRKLISLGRGELDKSAISELTFPGRVTE